MQLSHKNLVYKALLKWYLENGVNHNIEYLRNDNVSLLEENKVILNKENNHKFQELDTNVSNLKNCKNLLELEKTVMKYEGCSLKKTAINTVFSDGNPSAKVMLIGEAPGEEEDKTGRPFVGAAGILLNKMLNAIGQDRNNTYITNILFWRPPGNRKPTEEEINICLPFVHKHVELVNPNILVLVGAIAAKAFYKTDNGITQIRGNWKNISIGNIKNIKSIAIFHPAFLLRQPARKREAWEDLKKIKIEIDRNT